MVFAASMILAACGEKDDSTNADSNDESRVRVVNDVNDSDNDLNKDEEPMVEEDEDPVIEEDSEDDVEEVETVIREDGMEVAGATAADGVTVNAYNYFYQDGKLVFEWTTKNSTSNYTTPEVHAGIDANSSNIVVTFPSLKADYVVSGLESPVDLGGVFPELEFMTKDKGSQYTFNFDSIKEFNLKSVPSENLVVLEITL
jgi:hypothetical protein